MLGVLLQRRPSPVEVANDLDGAVVNWWTQVRDRPQELQRLLDATPDWSRRMYDQVIQADWTEGLEGAYNWMLAQTWSFSGKLSAPGTAVKALYDKQANSQYRISPFVIQHLADRMRRVMLENMPARIYAENWWPPSMMCSFTLTRPTRLCVAYTSMGLTASTWIMCQPCSGKSAKGWWPSQATRTNGIISAGGGRSWPPTASSQVRRGWTPNGWKCCGPTLTARWAVRGRFGMSEKGLKGLIWAGGKSSWGIGSGRWVARQLPHRRVYIEPFAGMLGVLLQRPPARREMVSDLDGRIINWWRVVRDQGPALEKLLDNTPGWSAAEFQVACEAETDPDIQANPLMAAYWFTLRMSWTFAGKPKAGKRDVRRSYTSDPVGTFLSLPLRGLQARMKKGGARTSRTRCGCLNATAKYGRRSYIVTRRMRPPARCTNM